jgi:hypothetical protein
MSRVFFSPWVVSITVTDQALHGCLARSGVDLRQELACRFAKFRCSRPTIWVPRNAGPEALAGDTTCALFSLFHRCFRCVHKAVPMRPKSSG